MKTNRLTLPLTALLLLLTLAAGSARAAGLELAVSRSWELKGEQEGALMGYAVAGAGDVNDDGFDDALIGVSKWDDPDGDISAGQALLFLGSASGLQGAQVDEAAWSFVGENQAAEFGGALAGGGDFNRDGRDDVLVGSPQFFSEDLQSYEGAAYLFLGQDTGTGDAPLALAWRVESNQKLAYLGKALAIAGDIDNDGDADLVIGAPGYERDTDHINEGAIFVIYGDAEIVTPTLTTPFATGGVVSAQLGSSVNGAGDVNHDGYADVLVGAPTYDPLSDPADPESDRITNAGAVFLYYGSASGLQPTPGWVLYGDQVEARLGSAASSAGDLNDDGYADIIVGSPSYDAFPHIDPALAIVNNGRIDIFFGGESGPGAAPNWSWVHPTAGAGLGIDVAPAGDTNGDGFPEVLAGAYNLTAEQFEEGAVYAFFGCGCRDGLIARMVWTVQGNKQETSFGFAVDGAGDVNHDGLNDVLVGAPHFFYTTVQYGMATLFEGTEQQPLLYSFFPLILAGSDR